jgi:hypothetical protein
MTRAGNMWRPLEREQRLVACAACGLFVSMLLPWYSTTDTFIDHGAAAAVQTTSNAFQAFSFVEAAVLLVGAAVIALVFARGEARSFQLPGGDGAIVMIAGGWSSLLIFYRLLDKPGVAADQRLTATVGLQWGIFVALLMAVGLVYAGSRMRAAEHHAAPGAADWRPGDGAWPGQPAPGQRVSARPVPASPGEGSDEQPSHRVPVAQPATDAAERAPAGRRRPRYPPAPAGPLPLEDPPRR